MQSDTRTMVAATFPDRTSAEACLATLRTAHFRAPWLAVTTAEPADATDATKALGAAPAAAHPAQSEPHAVAESSDGIFGALGRYFRGELSLRASLVERGTSDADAREIDASLPAGGAVVTVDARERVDEAASILSRGAIRIFGAEGERFARYPSTTDTVAGQGDELDRGSDRNRSGGGLGATTGFWSEAGARKDMRSNEISELGDDTNPAGDGAFTERRSSG